MLLGKHVNKYYLRFLPLYLSGVVGLVVVDYFQLRIPEYLGALVDLFKDHRTPSVSEVKKLIIGVLIVAVVMLVGRILWRLTIFAASHKTEAAMREKMFAKCTRLSGNFYRANKVGSIMDCFTTDLETIEEYLGWGSIMLFDAVFLSLLVILRMVRLDWVLSLILFVPLLLIVLWGALVEKSMAKRWDARQRQFDRLYDFSQESFTGIRVIKAFLKENKKLREFSKIAKANKDANIDFVKFSVLSEVLISAIIALIVAVILGVGGYFSYAFITGKPCVVFSHTVALGAGDLVTFLGYFEIMVWPMMALGQIISMHSRAKASLRRVSNFLDAEEDVKSPENAVVLQDVAGKIEFKDFTFCYADATEPALQNVSLCIRPGETVGIVGRLGSGKSTLVSALLRLHNYPEGSVFLDDVDLMRANLGSLRDCVAFVPQDTFLFSDTVENNIAFGRENATHADVERAAAFACIDADVAGFKDGYDTQTGERGMTLSGGQKQRVSIARAYLKDAPVLVLDDAVAAVDLKTEAQLLENVRATRQGKTTLLIASRVSTVAGCDRILVLSDGKVEAFDTPENLPQISPTYNKMVRLQAMENELKGGDAHGRR